VIEDHEKDGDGSKAFYVRSKASILGSSPGFIACSEVPFVKR
jgi:hypothetical protein